jgi:hypothetical protein
MSKSLIMNKKGRIESIHDYVESAKGDKAGPYDDIVFVEPFTMLPFNWLTLAVVGIGLVILSIVGMAILIHSACRG